MFDNAPARKNICVLIRCFNRLEDLAVCIDCIRKFKNHNYSIVIAFNGHHQGYALSDACRQKADHVVYVSSNKSHTNGSAALLIEGCAALPSKSEYIILLEADTWLLDESIVNKYIQLLSSSAAVWASSRWNDRLETLGVDFAIVKYPFVKDHTPMFDFKIMAEEYVCWYLKDHGFPFIHMDEFHPITMTRLLHPFFHCKDRRIKDFPRARVVTHHIEDFKRGLLEKKEHANICACENIFPDVIMEQHVLIKKNKSLHRYHKTIAWFNNLFFWYHRRRRIPKFTTASAQ